MLEAFKVLTNLVIGFYHNVIDAEVNSVAQNAPYFAYCLYSFLSLYSPWLGGRPVQNYAYFRFTKYWVNLL